MRDLRPLSKRPTRREFLALVGLGVGTIFLPGAASRAASLDGPADSVSTYRSRPDLSPPAVAIATGAQSVAPGHVFVAPASGPGQHGPLIVDNRGEPVWFLPIDGALAHNFRVQRYRGSPVLTWWEGQVTHGYGQGEYVIADASYRELKRFKPLNGYLGDLHEFTLTSRGSALVTIYNEVGADLSAVGGPASGSLLEGVFQEIDLHDDRLLLEWHSAEHVAVTESYRPENGGLWDYFHINSLGVLPDEDLLVSARHTSTVYKVGRRSGDVLWRLGGKKSDFEMGAGTAFAYQHDARGHPGDLVSIFDDGAYSTGSAIEPTSRAIVLALDTDARSARLVRANLNPQGSLTTAMGSAQTLSDGGMFAGWGTVPSFSEFSPAGELRFDARFAGGSVSYRAFRQPWRAHPVGRPAVASVRNLDGTLDVYSSWNGATDVAYWRILGGAGAETLQALTTVPRDGFETGTRLSLAPAVVAVSALDAGKRTLGTSNPLET